MIMYDLPLAIGTRILVEVEMDETHAVKSDFLVIPPEVGDAENKRCLVSTTVGEVVQLGSAALETALLTDSEDELCPGKIVLFLQNAGVTFKHRDEHKIYRLLGRGDIMAIIGEA